MKVVLVGYRERWTLKKTSRVVRDTGVLTNIIDASVLTDTTTTCVYGLKDCILVYGALYMKILKTWVRGQDRSDLV